MRGRLPPSTRLKLRQLSRFDENDRCLVSEALATEEGTVRNAVGIWWRDLR